MNLGPLKDKSKRKKSLMTTIGKQGVYAIAFVCLAVVGIVLAVTLTAGTPSDLQNKPTTNVTIKPSIKPTDPGVDGPGTVTKPQEMVAPVDGEVLKEFTVDTLVFNNTLAEWSTHAGVDIACQEDAKIVAALDGTILSAKTDIMLGNVIIIDHGEGLKTVYAGLKDIEDSLKEGSKVTQGTAIGTAGNTAISEIAEGVHLHFEVLKDDKSVDPAEYLDDLTK